MDSSSHRRSSVPSPGSRPTLAERRAAAHRRRRALVRRRRVTVLAALLAVAVGVGVWAVVDGSGHPSSAGTTKPDSTTTTTRRTRPRPPSSYHVGLVVFHWTDATRTTVSPSGTAVSGRVLTTEVRYPTLRGSAASETPGAAPATKDGPFPVVVFAHGFDVSPSYYAPLLDSWVHAGFVVVSPVFPDENTTTVNANGGPYGSDATTLESDVDNEPGDIVYVLKQFGALVRKGAKSPLAGIADTSDLALAGQSDGADVVGGLVFGSAYASDLAAMSAKPKAVLILSGQPLYDGPGGVSDTTASSPTSPAVLQVQSDDDECNPAGNAANLFSALAKAPVHLFELLEGASHLQPYTNLVMGANAYAPVVEKVTTEFLELELGYHDKALSLAAVEKAAAVPNVSQEATVLDTDPILGEIDGAPDVTTCPGLPEVVTPTTTTTTTVAGG